MTVLHPETKERSRCTIVCFSNIDWRDVKQRHQILMEGLSGADRSVFFVENLGVRAPKIQLGDASRVFRRVVASLTMRGSDEDTGDVEVVAPIVAPADWPVGRLVNRTLLYRRLVLGLNRPEGKPTVAWVYLPTRAVSDLLDRLRPDKVVYDCTINFRAHPGAPADIQETEIELLKRADIVFADAESLFQRCSEVNPNTHRLPPGVHMDLFGRPEESVRIPEPPDLADINRPMALFFGAAKSLHFDWELLRAVAERLTGWAFALLGPVDSEVSAGLEDLDNVLLLGSRDHSRLPNYLWAADAILLPYRLNEFTEGTFPAKVYECLASGTPIVSTPLPELERQFSDHMLFGSTTESLSAALKEAAEDEPGARGRRVELAEQNSWNERIRYVEAELSDLLSN